METDKGALSFIEEWNWHSGASKTLGAGDVTGLLACGAGLSYASGHPRILPSLIWCLAEFSGGTLFFCLGYAVLYAAYLFKSVSDLQFLRWQSQSEEELALAKVGQARTPMFGDVQADESFRPLTQHSRLLHVALVLHGSSAIILFICLVQVLMLSCKMALLPVL